jgi:hypothetical protein
LDRTGVTSLSPSIGVLNNLELLSLDSNCLRDLPLTLGFCQKLTRVSLESNSFTCLPGVVLKLKNLKELRIENNPLIAYELAVPYKKFTANVNSLASSQPTMCTVSVLQYHMDHWKFESLETELWKASIGNTYALIVTPCVWCGAPISQGITVTFSIIPLKRFLLL